MSDAEDGLDWSHFTKWQSVAAHNASTKECAVCGRRIYWNVGRGRWETATGKRVDVWSRHGDVMPPIKSQRARPAPQAR